MDQRNYEYLKRKVQGYYHKFNSTILKWYMHKIFNYDYLLESAKNFETFSEFFEHHWTSREESIMQNIDLMYYEAKNKGFDVTKDLVKDFLIVRLGNIYTGMYTENKIIETFNNLSDYTSCQKSEQEVDTYYKVDAVVELIGIDKLAIQIKPVTFLKYDKGEELQFHERYTTEFQTKVYYIFYKDRDTIYFNGKEIKLSNKDKILAQIESLLT